MPRAAIIPLVALLMAAAPPAPSEPEDTTAAQLWKEAKAYHGKLVRIEGVVEHAHEQEPREGDARRYDLTLEGDIDLTIHGEGKPPAAKGDRVRITGTFTYKEDSFVRYRLAVTKVEKLPQKK
jgi:hypothetical protein